VNAEVLGDHILVTVWNCSCKAVVFLVSWKTGTVTLVSGFSKFYPVLNSHESLKLRMLPERLTTLHKARPMAVSINSSLVSLVEDYENRLEICKLELYPVPRLQTLCFLELPPLASGVSNFFLDANTEWVPTSKSYARTRSSRGCHLPFYSSAIGTIALRFQYQLLGKFHFIDDSYALIISVAALVSAIPTDVYNVPWEDWGPSSTHFYAIAPAPPLRPLGPFWIPTYGSLVVRQYDPRHTRYTLLMSGDKLPWQSWPPFNSMEQFQYGIGTHLPYRDVMMENKVLYQSTYNVADREWVVGITSLVRGFFDCIFRCESDHSHRQVAGHSITVYHVG